MPRRPAVKPVDRPIEVVADKRTYHERLAEVMDDLVDRLAERVRDRKKDIGPALIREVAALAKGAGVNLADARTMLELRNVADDPVLAGMHDLDVDALLDEVAGTSAASDADFFTGHHN